MSEIENDQIRTDLNDPVIELVEIQENGGVKWITIKAKCTEKQLKGLIPRGYTVEAFNNHADDSPKTAEITAPV